jgi:hypothetical protein
MVSLLLSKKQVARSSIHACTHAQLCTHLHAAVRTHGRQLFFRGGYTEKQLMLQDGVGTHTPGLLPLKRRPVALLLRFDATICKASHTYDARSGMCTCTSTCQVWLAESPRQEGRNARRPAYHTVHGRIQRLKCSCLVWNLTAFLPDGI